MYATALVPSLSPASSTLFRNAHNVPLKCFVQFDTAPDQVGEVKRLLELHGADVSPYIQHALVILVDPPTPGGQQLISQFGNDPNRAILDFGWVKHCVQKNKCIGPAENWGGHRLPVTNVNDFFSVDPSSTSAPRPPVAHSAPPAPVKATATYSPVPYAHGPQSQFHQTSTAPLPSPTVSQPLPPSPIASHRDRSEGDVKPPTPPLAAETTTIKEPPPTYESGSPEPTPPDPTSMVLHHNGMGAKFTEIDTNYIRNYFAWSQRNHPQRTQRQVLDKIHEKMSYHSAVSITQYMRRHPQLFAEYRKTDDPSAPKREKTATHRSRDVHPDVAYDPGTSNDDEPPKPPAQLIPFAKGYRFTTADDKFMISYFNWHFRKSPNSTKSDVLRDLASWAPYRSLPSWTAYFHKHQSEWRPQIPSLKDDPDEDVLAELEREDSAATENVAKSEEREVDLADGRRWNPPRKASPTKPIGVPAAYAKSEEDDGEYGEPDLGVKSPSDARRRRTSDGPRRRSIAFTAEERQTFIEYLAEHPWVWTTVTCPPEWKNNSTTASAVWAKYEKLHPHRSDASWREYHKRNAAEFDAEAKKLFQSRAARRPAPPPVLTPTEDEADQDPIDDFDDEDQYNQGPEGEEQGSSFSYHPLPIQQDDEEEDQLNTDDDEDTSMVDVSGTQSPATGAGSLPTQPARRGPGSRKGRPYLPFTQEEREKFVDFLADNPQVWVAATAEPGWITREQSQLGKDATWRKLAEMPGMEKHSYKSWREYHRTRAPQDDKLAKAKRIAREANKGLPELPQPTPPPIPAPVKLPTPVPVPAPTSVPAPAPIQMPRLSPAPPSVTVQPQIPNSTPAPIQAPVTIPVPALTLKAAVHPSLPLPPPPPMVSITNATFAPVPIVQSALAPVPTLTDTASTISVDSNASRKRSREAEESMDVDPSKRNKLTGDNKLVEEDTIMSPATTTA